MHYRLVVTTGPSLDETTQSIVHVNSENYVQIKSDNFEGRVTVRVANFSGLAPDGEEPISQSEYLNSAPDSTFSIDASGIYKTEGLTADDLLFGIVFRTSVVDRLPSSYPIGVRALQWINPNIVFQLEGDHPTVLSPLLAIVSNANTAPIPASQPAETLYSAAEATAGIKNGENITSLLQAQDPGSRASGTLEADQAIITAMQPSSSSSNGQTASASRGWFGYSNKLTPAKARQQWYSIEQVRKETTIPTDQVISTELQNGFIDFRDLSLRIPGMPFTVSLGHYMTGRPVQYCCISRDKTKLYWCVVFTILEEEEGGA